MLSGKTLGQYYIGDVIGTGAMGEVYRAEAPDGTVVAVKVLHPDFANDDVFAARFEREVRIMRSLKHPHILPLYDFGREGNYIYFAMRYVEGRTLSYLLRRQRVSLLMIWNLIKPIAGALEYGHEQGVLHRDIKPSNVLLERTDTDMKIFLSDYGLGKQPGLDMTLTDSGIAIGTPEYMSPEAALGIGTDVRSDVYSLAILTYEMIIGDVPFTDKDTHKIALAQVKEPPPHLCDRNPDLPPYFAGVIMKSLAKNPDERHQSIRHFAETLYQALLMVPEDQRQTVYWV